MSRITQCFGIEPGDRTIAFTGAGGKSSLMYAMAEEILSLGETVVTTTTTKILAPGPSESPFTILLTSDPELHGLEEALRNFRHVTVGRHVDPSTGKLEGVDDETLQMCLASSDRLLVEADGSARKPIKAPEQWEPVVPEMTDLLIPVVGLDCLGQPATEGKVFRLQRFLNVTGLHKGENITAEAVAKLLIHPDGSLKGAGAGTRVVPFLNKADTLQFVSVVERISREITTHSGGRIKSLVYGSLRKSWCRRIDL